MSHAKHHNISDNTLKYTYSLAFSKITSAIIYHYRNKIGGVIEVVIKPKVIVVLRNGKVHETLTLSAIDKLFNQVDIQELRKNLKNM